MIIKVTKQQMMETCKSTKINDVIGQTATRQTTRWSMHISQSCQISPRSDWKQRSLRLFKRVAPKRTRTTRWV